MLENCLVFVLHLPSLLELDRQDMAHCQRSCSALRTISAFIIVLCGWPFLPVLAGIFFIYRKILGSILTLKYGDKYGGLFDVTDGVWLIKDKCNSTAICVMIAKCDEEKDMHTFMEEQTRTKIFSDPKAYPKLTSTHRIFGGYPFWVRNDYELHECLKTLPISDDREFDEEYLKVIISNLYDAPHPKNGTALWDIHVSPKHLENYKNDGFYYYPLVLRLNHSICDGTSLFEFLVQWLASNNANTYCTNIFKTHSSGSLKKPKILVVRILHRMKKILNLTLLGLYVIFIGTVYILKASYLKIKDQNALHGPELSGKKIITWRAEENPEYISMVKRIKRRVPGTKFSQILGAAVSASFTDYFKKSHQPVPDIFSSVKPILLDYPDIDKSKPVPLENKTIFVVQECPTNKNGLLDTLEEIKLYEKKVTYGDKIACGFFATFAGICPLPISTLFIGPMAYTYILTNVPGCGKICLDNGDVLDSLVGFGPNMKGTGIVLTTTSYDDKLEIGIIIDKAIISSRSEVQNLIDDIFHYIKCLHIETRKIYSDQ